jgi:hypothetical protein
MQLQLKPPLASQSMSLPVFVTVGHWKPERLAELTTKAPAKSDPAAKPRRSEKLPARLPQEILLAVGQADLFPYRIEYRQQATTQDAGAAGTPAPYQLSAFPLADVEFADISFTAAIAANQFDYSPGDAKWDDRTNEQLQRVRRERQLAVTAASRPEGSAAPPNVR